MKSSEESLTSIDAKWPLTSLLISVIGVTLSMWGASWDITSHLLRIPETFFTPSHVLLYSGVGVSIISAAISLVVLLIKKQTRKTSFALGLKLIVLGAVMQLIAGPGDFYWHDMFGIDGLLSPTHITLAIGILIVSMGSLIGFARIRSYISEPNNLVKIILPVSFGIFWFSVMWAVFFFVLPISEGDTHNFNPDPYVAITLSFVALPFVFSVVFWSAVKTSGRFGTASASALVFVVMNVTSNIFTSENLLFYLPLFAMPMVCAVLADYILNKEFKSKILSRHFAKISGAILGSMFFLFCFPMLAMTFLDIYLFNDVFSYDVLPSVSNTILDILMLTIVPGAISGMIGMMLASRKITQMSNPYLVADSKIA